jgi:hypothetical protein
MREIVTQVVFLILALFCFCIAHKVVGDHPHKEFFTFMFCVLTLLGIVFLVAIINTILNGLGL